MSARILVVAVLAALAPVAQAQKPKKDPEVAKLEARAEKLEAELKIVREKAAALQRIKDLEAQLEAAKKGKPVKKPSRVVEIRPRWTPPGIRPGEIVIVKDHKGRWWSWERRPDDVTTVHEYNSEGEARRNVESLLRQRTDYVLVTLAQLKRRVKK